LDSFPDIGPASKMALLKNFESIEAMKRVGVKEIISTAGLRKRNAERFID